MATVNSGDKGSSKTIDGKVLEFLMDLSDFEAYIGSNIWHEITDALCSEDRELIMSAIKALYILIKDLQIEIRSKDKQIKEREEQIEERIKMVEAQRQIIERSWKECLTERNQMERELKRIYRSQFGKYLRAKKLYEEDKWSLSKIARKLNVNRDTVKKHLVDLGVELRENKGGRPKSPVKDIKKYDILYVDIDEIATDIE